MNERTNVKNRKKRRMRSNKENVIKNWMKEQMLKSERKEEWEVIRKTE